MASSTMGTLSPLASQRPSGGPMAAPAPVAALPYPGAPPSTVPMSGGSQPLAAPFVPHTTIPGVAPYQPPAPLGPPPGTIPTGQFTGAAPTLTPTGQFTAPDMASYINSQDYQDQIGQADKATQRSAAFHGNLLSGGTLRSLQDNAARLARGGFQQYFNNSLQSYGTNRDTNAQNFGQNQTVFGDTLAGYGTNRDTNAQNFGQKQTQFGDTLPVYDRAVTAAHTTQDNAQAELDRQAAVQNQAQQEYAQSVEAQRQAAVGGGGMMGHLPAGRPAGGGPGRTNRYGGNFNVDDSASLNNPFGRLPYPGYSYGQ